LHPKCKIRLFIKIYCKTLFNYALSLTNDIDKTETVVTTYPLIKFL